ncbi:MAG: hypothetical protein F4Z40_03660 [Chloroflexi bacterium]|nr:hypothetical protein [Chloroflexota bacterium]
MPRFVDNLTIEDFYEIEEGEAVQAKPCPECGSDRTFETIRILCKPWATSRAKEKYFVERGCFACAWHDAAQYDESTMTVLYPGEDGLRRQTAKRRSWGYGFRDVIKARNMDRGMPKPIKVTRLYS